jgi:hypothetical protein
MSDQLKGQIKDWKRNHRGVFSTGGPWRKPAEMTADSKRGRTAIGAGDISAHKHSYEKHQGRATTPARWGVPESTHYEGSAIAKPKKARRQPVSGG